MTMSSGNRRGSPVRRREPGSLFAEAPGAATQPHGMQLSGTLVAAPSAAPSEGHAEFSFGVTAPPAAGDAVVPMAAMGARGAAATLVPPGNAPDTNPVVAVVVPAGVVPNALSGARPGTFGSIVVPGRPAPPNEDEEL
jgi:hypothetical protein